MSWYMVLPSSPSQPCAGTLILGRALAGLGPQEELVVMIWFKTWPRAQDAGRCSSWKLQQGVIRPGGNQTLFLRSGRGLSVHLTHSPRCTGEKLRPRVGCLRSRGARFAVGPEAETDRTALPPSRTGGDASRVISGCAP